MTAWPMTPTEHDRAFEGIRLAAEYEQTQQRIEAGHEFAALMEPGGLVLLAAAWRQVETVTAASDRRVVIRCTDASEWLANRSATRPYVDPSVPLIASGSEVES